MEVGGGWLAAYSSMGSAYFNQNILNSWTLLFKALPHAQRVRS